MRSSYVHTTGSIPETNELKLIDKYVDWYLFSLIGGMSQQNFGFNTLHQITEDIKKYRIILNNNDKKFIIDSGGYSIIAGQVSPRDVNKFIECYSMFLEKDALDNCSYIMSLDIPIFLKYPKNNTVKYIYEANTKSISESVKILKKNPELYEKFVFVYQFKIPKQNKIWKQIYDEQFRNDENLRNFAIGGLVGLRGITNIKFSPFIAPAYRCLKHISDRNLDFRSLIHILGIYHYHDRTILAFMNKLFDKYTEDEKFKTHITYDTINYTLSGLYKLREQIVFIPEDDKYIYDYSYNLIDKIDRIIFDENILKIIKTDLQKILNNEQVNDVRISSLINTITQVIIDRIIIEELEKNNILDLFIECKSFNIFKLKFRPILKMLEQKYPPIFGGRTEKNLKNFQFVYAMDDWWRNNRDETELEKLMEKFISLIGFPFDLQE